MLVKSKKRTISLKIVEENWKDCTKCYIGEKVRHHVFYDTIPKDLQTVDIVFIGEGPGIVEDVEGIPFVGPAGLLLRETIVKCPNYYCDMCGGSGCEDGRLDAACEFCEGYGKITIGLTNLISCRPFATTVYASSNRSPKEEEIENCFPRLLQTVRCFKPDMIIALGREAESQLQNLRMLLEDNYGIVTISGHTYHPSYILRQNSEVSEEQYIIAINNIFQKFWTYRKKQISGTYS